MTSTWQALGGAVGLSGLLAVLLASQLSTTSAALPSSAAAAAVRLPSPAPSPGLVPELPASAQPVTTRSAGSAASTPAASTPAASTPAATSAAAAPAAAPPAAAQGAPAQPAASLCSGDGWQQRRGAAALASLQGGAARTGFRVEFTGARKGYLGLTHLNERRIEMFVRACGTQSDELLRHVMAHELGHAYDTTHGSAATRRAWMAARGIPVGTPWYGCSGCTDFATPAGDFAEVYAQWARGASSNRSELAGDVAPAALAQLAGQFFGA